MAVCLPKGAKSGGVGASAIDNFVGVLIVPLGHRSLEVAFAAHMLFQRRLSS